ncbi:DUF255 domain-containing protein [Halocatena marina]|uniref:DUF255 domain-containing protein n=1 Tax=Halocatena marina TaxID=2934937 RepID=UPI00200BB5FD|nr:DUF255 domain-containing protein [Halocatena marina]
MCPETLINWRDWGPAPFEEARAATRPVLLSISAPWCEWCATMDREAFSNPAVAANIHDDFIPIRIDADRHPRVRDRYTMGGFPSTVFLTPEGEVITGATYMETESLRSVLERVRETWTENDGGSIPRALRDTELPRDTLDERIVTHMEQQVQAAFDDEFGGWGDGPKFPLPRTIEFALKRDRSSALRTLEAIATHLYDTYDGGFFRYAGSRDWSDLHREKVLDTNAAICRAFTTAYLYTGEDRYREPAQETIEYLTTTLWTGDAFAGSQAAGEYYTLEPTERESQEPPFVDETVFADRTSLAVDALCRFYAVTDNEGARRYAERALSHVLETLVNSAGTVCHFDGGSEGLLLDQARVLQALTTAAQILDQKYIVPAQTVADWTIEHRERDGAFVDGSDGPALLDRPLQPLDTTVELADALIDLAVLTQNTEYRSVARTALESFAGAHDRMGVTVANYASAVARVVNTPLVIEIADEPGSDLHRAALRVADHEKIVVLTGESDGKATVLDESGQTGPVTTPDALVSLIEDA